jgi:hypothetical protein
MRIRSIELGFQRHEDRSLYWSWFEYMREGCDCSIFSFLCFYITILRGECRD